MEPIKPYAFRPNWHTPIWTWTYMDLEIIRLGDVITVFPARNSTSEVVAELRRMPRPIRVEERQPIEFGEWH